MVSATFITSILTAILTLSASAQTKASLSAEQRADILMARKMYREAVEVYKEAPLDSAVTWNKIGMVAVLTLAASAAGPPSANITVTGR